MNTTIKKILLVDDEERLLSSMKQRLLLMGFDVYKASSGTQAIDVVNHNKIDMAIVDLKMPDMDGLVTIARLKEIAPGLKTVLLTGYGSPETRKETQNLESEYFEKDSMSQLWNLIKNLKKDEQFTVIHSPEASSASPQDTVQTPTGTVPLENELSMLPKMIGETSAMQLVRKNIKRLSSLDCTILIKGETGTGRELSAKTIHALSQRKNQRFLAFNCGCFSSDFHFEEMLRSIEPDSIVPQKQKNEFRGFSGTILLDQIEIMPEDTQHQLLKILEEKKFYPVTGTGPAGEKQSGVQPVTVDIRFMIATQQDLKLLAKKKKFNPVLYKKLNAIEMNIPSLKDRRDDILPLSRYFLTELNKEFSKQIETFSDSVIDIFMSYPFPGNVRELRHIIERAVILADGRTIDIKHLPERFSNPGHKTQESSDIVSLKKLEEKHILKVIDSTNGNRSKAAEILGISRAALWRKLKAIQS